MRLHTIILSLLALLGLAYAADAYGGRQAAFTVVDVIPFHDDTAGTAVVPGFPARLGTLNAVEIGVEVDAEWNVIFLSDTPDVAATSWSASLSGSPMPPASAEGTPGYSRYALLAQRPGGGGVVAGQALCPVRSGSVLPGSPFVVSEAVDNDPAYPGPPVTENLDLFLADEVSIPYVTSGVVWNVGNSQGSNTTFCTALGRVYVRYLYTPN